MYRALSTLPKQPVTQLQRTLLKPITTTTTRKLSTTPKMSLFPRAFISEDPVSTSFGPLFRLLEDFDDYSRGTGTRQSRTQLRTFTPKFDVKETAQAYELHGELPGIDQKDVEIEFTDRQTLTIKGRTERSYQKGTPPAGFIEEPKMASPITEGGEGEAQQHHGETAVTKSGGEKEPESKYWVTERSVGEYSRSFSFPANVDQDQVTASMKNGILSILVPKARKAESKKITIS